MLGKNILRCPWFSPAVAALGLFVCGCSFTPPGGKVNGTVLLDGQKLASAGVTFWPTRENLELGVYSGRTDDQGRFELSSRAGKMVKPGRYVALITLEVKKDGKVPGPGDDWNLLKRPGALHNILPPQYNDRDNPMFTVEVKVGSNDFSFEVKHKP